jgi:hypothetical protein
MLDKTKVLLLPIQIGTIKEGISMEMEGGWKVIKKEEVAGEYLVTVELTSVDLYQYTAEFHAELHKDLVEHTHHYTVSSDLFTFDHSPTESEIETAAIARGFNLTIDNNPSDLMLDETNNTIRKRDAIRIITPGQEDVLDYNSRTHPAEFTELFNMIPITIDSIPASISLKGDWLYIYYTSLPTQFFTEEFLLYSVRIHKDTGMVRRKGYVKEMILNKEVTDTLEGFDVITNIIGTGVFLDEPKVTIYYALEGAAANPLTPGDTPYYGVTWEEGVQIRTREYTREMNDV